jgi:PAS domain S-box-containing protein
MSRSANDDTKYYRLANFVALISVVVFGLLRVTLAFSVGEYRSAIIAIAGNSVAFLTILIMRFTDNKVADSALLTPFLIYFIYTVVCLYIGDFTYFFALNFALCAFAAMYFNSVKLLQFILCSNIMTFVLGMNGTLRVNLGDTMPRQEVLLKCFLLFSGSAFIYLVTSFAHNKKNKSIQAEDYFSALLSATPTMVAVLDAKNRVTYVSRSFAGFVHLEDPKMHVGRSLIELISHNMGARNILEDILKQDSFGTYTRKVVIDGRVNYYEVIMVPLSNETKGKLVNIIDITPIMQAKFNAEEASHSKSAFLATVSHEIRTPLNAIIGLSEIELQKSLPGDTYANLERIFSSGSNLLFIINDILDISKIDAGSMEIVPVNYNVPTLVSNSVQLNIVRIGSKPINFELDISSDVPVKLCGDELRVKQILNNLLSNAFKYTHAGLVKLTVNWEPVGGDARVTFIVRDTGQGIRPEDVGKLFVEYKQLDTNANRNIEGTGLGLSITKRLVEMMGGSISVESEYGKGSAFTVSIAQKIVDETPIGSEAAAKLKQFRFSEFHERRRHNLPRSLDRRDEQRGDELRS